MTLSTSIADASGGWVGGTTELGTASATGSADAVACADEGAAAAAVANWGNDGGGGGFGVGGRNRGLASCALLGAGGGSVTLDMTGDAPGRNTGRGGVASVACLLWRFGVDGVEMVIERTGS